MHKKPCFSVQNASGKHERSAGGLRTDGCQGMVGSAPHLNGFMDVFVANRLSYMMCCILRLVRRAVGDGSFKFHIYIYIICSNTE